MKCDICGKRANDVLYGVIVCKNCSHLGEKLKEWKMLGPNMEPPPPEPPVFRKKNPKTSNPKKCPTCGSQLHTWCHRQGKWWD